MSEPSTPLRRVYRAVVPGVETLPQGLSLPRHRHACGYATVVLAGSFVEASFAGRFRVEPGDVLLHAAFDCHANWVVAARRLQILRLPWPPREGSDPVPEGRFIVRDPDWLARLCERDPSEAAYELHGAVRAFAARAGADWPAELAAALSRTPPVRLGQWAASRGLAPASVSRGFRRAFGASPKQFRLETRARRAWTLLTHTRASLTAIAHDLEFADLAHMSRSVRALTGFSPSAWRSAQSRADLLSQLRSSRAS
jgi:AraC-like DNA-binding protein